MGFFSLHLLLPLQTFVYNHFMLEQMSHLCGRHTFAIVPNCNLNSTFCFEHLARNPHMPTRRRIFTCIVGQRVEHEERERPVGFYNGFRRLYYQLNAFVFETKAAFFNNVKQILQSKALDVEIELPLLQLNPLCQRIIIFINLAGQLANISIACGTLCRGLMSMIQHINLVQNAINKRSDDVHQSHLSTLLNVATQIVRQMKLGHVALVFHSLQSLIDLRQPLFFLHLPLL